MLTKFTEGLSSEEAEKWANSMSTKIDLADTWASTGWETAKASIDTKLDTIASETRGLGALLAEDAFNKKNQSLATSLESRGFDLGHLGVSQDGWGKYTGITK
jgi:hypothetical protein